MLDLSWAWLRCQVWCFWHFHCQFTCWNQQNKRMLFAAVTGSMVLGTMKFHRVFYFEDKDGSNKTKEADTPKVRGDLDTWAKTLTATVDFGGRGKNVWDAGKSAFN